MPYTITGPAMVNIFAPTPRMKPSACVNLGPIELPNEYFQLLLRWSYGFYPMDQKSQIFCCYTITFNTKRDFITNIKNECQYNY